MAYRTIQRVSVPNLKLFGSMKTELWANESWRIFYYVTWENGLVGILCPPTRLPRYKCIEIFETLTSYNSLSEKSSIQIFDDNVANQKLPLIVELLSFWQIWSNNLTEIKAVTSCSTHKVDQQETDFLEF